MAFTRPEYWSGYPFPSPGDLPNPGIEPRSPTLQLDSLQLDSDAGKDWAPQLEETPETPPSSRAEGLLFLHGLESNPESSLQTSQEA